MAACEFDGHRFQDWSTAVYSDSDEDQLGWAMEELEAVAAKQSPDPNYQLLWSRWDDDRVYFRAFCVVNKRQPGGQFKGQIKPTLRLHFINAFMRYPRTDFERCDCGRAMVEAPADMTMCAICSDEWEELWTAKRAVKEVSLLINKVERAVNERANQSVRAAK